MAQHRGLSGGAIKNPLFTNVSQSALLEELAASNRLIVGVAPPPVSSISQNAPQTSAISEVSSTQQDAFNSVPLYSSHQPSPLTSSLLLEPPTLTQPLSTTNFQPLHGQQLPSPQQQNQQSTTFTDVPLTADSGSQPPPPPLVLPTSGPPPPLVLPANSGPPPPSVLPANSGPPPPSVLPNSGPPPLTGYSRVSPLSRYPRSYIQTTHTPATSGVNIFAPSLPTVPTKLFTPERQPSQNSQPTSAQPTSTNYSQFPENSQLSTTDFTSYFTPPNVAITPESQNNTQPQPSLQRALAAAVSKVFTGSAPQQQASKPADPVKQGTQILSPQPEPKLLPGENHTVFSSGNFQDHSASTTATGPSEEQQPSHVPDTSPSLSSFFAPQPSQNLQVNPPESCTQYTAPPPNATLAPFQSSPVSSSPVSQAFFTQPVSSISFFQPTASPLSPPSPPAESRSAPPPPAESHSAPPPPAESHSAPPPPPPAESHSAPPPPVSQGSPFSVFTPSHQAVQSKSQDTSVTEATQPTVSSSAFASVSTPSVAEAHAPSLPSAASFFAPPPTNRDSPFRPIKPISTPVASSVNSLPSSITSQTCRESTASSFFNNIGQPSQVTLFTPSEPPPTTTTTTTASEPPAAVLPVSTECLVAPSPAVEIIPSVLFFDGPPPSVPYQSGPPSSAAAAPRPQSTVSKTPSSSVSHTPPPTYASLGFQKAATGGPLDDVVDGEELHQVPLENTVPLYNPKTIGVSHSQSKKDEVHNLYRVATGLKRPSYAPPPDLPVVSNPAVNQDYQPVADMASDQQQHRQSLGRPSPQTPPRHEDSTGFTAEAATNLGHYRPAYHHWFFKRGDGRTQWQPFSVADSLNLEHAFSSSDINENTTVATDGGRYDVEVVKRKKHAVFWEELPGEVRRCSWFVKSLLDSQYVPYDENIAELLEDEFRAGCLRNEWNRRVELADGEVIVLHSAYAMAHYQRPTTPDVRTNPPQMQLNPRIVKRGMEDFEISEGEPTQVDHLVLVVHGIGKVCDLRFRSLVQVVDDFRAMSLQLTQAHFRRACETGQVGRVEILPVEWHQALHTETIDKRLADITLPSIPKAREFTNDTILDVLFYSSPVFCEKIVQAVGAELNRVYSLYRERNPSFRGEVSLGGHSLGSLILFDMLSHQKPVTTPPITPLAPQHDSEDDEFSGVGFTKTKARVSRRMSYLKIGTLGAGQPFITYPQLNFHPKAFFAFGSPIGMFLTVRGMESLGDGFKFPTCPKFYNIFHPNDPVAYRVEALISNEMANVPPVLIPHHKGRKRMHLELKETMAHVTAALKAKLVESIRSTWNSVYQLAMFQRSDPTFKNEVDQVLDDEVMRDHGDTLPSPQLSSNQSVAEDIGLDLQVGSLNGGNRIDYVLQEAPLETFNQYISAIRSHLVYWESEDTALLVLKEIYKTLNISADSQVTHQMVPFDISRSTEDQYTEYTDSIGAPPTQFVRK